MNKYNIQIATKKARQGNVKRGKIAALAFSGSGELIASAHNRRITINLSHKVWTEHAEISLINKLRKIKAFSRYNNITVFVLRISSCGIKMAKPCERCQIQLSKYPIRILYTDCDGLILPLTLQNI